PSRRGGTDSHARVYEVALPTPAARVSAAVYALGFSRDGRRLLAQGTGWEVTSTPGQGLLRPTGVQAEYGQSYYAGPGGQYWSMASGTEVKPPQRPKLRQVAPQAREVVLPARTEPGSMPGLVISPDGKHLLLLWRRHLYHNRSSYSLQDRHELWDVSGPEPVLGWEKSADNLGTTDAQFSPDGRWVAN